MPAPPSCQAKLDLMNIRVGEILRLPVLSLDLITSYQFGNRHFVHQFAVREFEIRDCFLHQCTHILARNIVVNGESDRDNEGDSFKA